MSELYDELDRVEKLRPGSDDYQKEFLKIHNEKLIRIRQVRVTMLGLYIACQVYKGNKECDLLDDTQEYIDFESLANMVRDIFGEKYVYRSIILGEGNFYQDISIIDKLFSLNYKSPSDVISIYNHLVCLEHCYEHFYKIPPTILYMRLDLSMGKLLAAAHKTTYIYFIHGKKELTRQKKSTESILLKKNIKRDMAIVMFYEMNTDGMTFNKIEEGIASKLKPIVVSIHPKTVERYLMSDAKVRADLEAEGVIKKQT